MNKFYFKKKLFGGMVLMIASREPGHMSGEFIQVWNKATEKEAQNFISDVAVLEEKVEKQDDLLREIKMNHPEFMI